MKITGKRFLSMSGAIGSGVALPDGDFSARIMDEIKALSDMAERPERAQPQSWLVLRLAYGPFPEHY